MVLDADTRRVLWIGEGRNRNAVRSSPGATRPRPDRIGSVAMSTAFDLEVRQQHRPKRPGDLRPFYVIAKYGREVFSGCGWMQPTSCAMTSWPTGG